MEAHNSFGATRTATRWGLAEGRLGGPRGFETYILIANTTTLPADVKVTFLRPDADPIERSYSVAPSSRFNLPVGVRVPELMDAQFGAIVESTNGVPIVVERSMFWNALGIFWAGGTNVAAVPLPE